MCEDVMFNGVKVGDRVWSMLVGQGVVSEIVDDTYPLRISFDCGRVEFYTMCGRWSELHLNPTLFWNEWEIPAIYKKNRENATP